MALLIPPGEVGPDGVWRGSFRNPVFYAQEINFSGTTGSWIAVYNPDTAVVGRGYVILADRNADVLNVAPEY